MAGVPRLRPAHAADGAATSDHVPDVAGVAALEADGFAHRPLICLRARCAVRGPSPFETSLRTHFRMTGSNWSSRTSRSTTSTKNPRPPWPRAARRAARAASASSPLRPLRPAARPTGTARTTRGSAGSPADRVREHVPDLAVLALAHREREPHVEPGSRSSPASIAPYWMPSTSMPFLARRALLRHLAERAHAIAPQPAGRRQFQRAGEPAVVGQQQQPFGVEVEPADADQPRQSLGQPPKMVGRPCVSAELVTRPRGLWNRKSRVRSRCGSGLPSTPMRSAGSR